jgi:ABC-type sugar transport system substrate-binding protein
MIRTSMKTPLLLLVAAVLALGSMAEAAPAQDAKPGVKNSTPTPASSSTAGTSAKKKKKKAKHVKKPTTQKTQPPAKSTTKPR